MISKQDKNTSGPTVVVETVQPVSPHNRALYEAGKELLTESVSVGRDFCKFMIGTSTGAIPIYLALLALVLPQEYKLTSTNEVYFLIPAALFLIATILFVMGYFPQQGTMSLDIPDEIERERVSTIKRRRKYSILGFISFCCGIVLAVWMTVLAMGVQTN